MIAVFIYALTNQTKEENATDFKTLQTRHPYKPFIMLQLLKYTSQLASNLFHLLVKSQFLLAFGSSVCFGPCV